MITPEEKDALLIKLIEHPDRDRLSIDSEFAGITFGLLSSLLKQFERKNLVTIKSMGGKGYDVITVSVEIDADDFIYSRGGFVFEEEIFRNNFTKLQIELENLEKANPTINFNKAAKLVGAVASGFDIYKHLNP